MRLRKPVALGRPWCVLLKSTVPGLFATIKMQPLSAAIRPPRRDADDDMVLEVAVNGSADAIVTFNRRDFRPATERFGIEVLLPGAAIERLGGIS